VNDFHEAVLLKEVLAHLQINTGGKYIDATIGGGGHTQAILSQGGKVLGIDQDQDSLDFVQKRLGKEIKNQELLLEKGNFRELDRIARLKNFTEVDGILFDLGVSSYQINTAERGFSFLKEGPLDMRMDKDSPVTAEALVNLLGKGELYDLFNKLGQEHRAGPISNSIIRARRIKPIQTTEALAQVVKEAYGIKGELSVYARTNINKRVFQALRIAVNDELESIKIALPQALELLGAGGRIAVISFHSLEDGIVKRAFKEFREKNMGRIITEKPIEATEEEIALNSRSKPAKLRVFEKK
jgi:16S rRNA (cytosine1402-N4)-methyltransferase